MQEILVIGGNGQLGNCFRKLVPLYSLDYQFCFVDCDELDITNSSQIRNYLDKYRPDFCINASAYTAVDLAEVEREKAFAVNAYGIAFLAEICDEVGVELIHISTDYVFDGNTQIPYSEDDFTNPLGVYGESKREGEKMALENNENILIIRTSWLYSEYGKNFVKTMLSLFDTQKELNVVADQFGQPTNANDLAEVVMHTIQQGKKYNGIFHFSNYPETSWYHFAEKIAYFSGKNIKINPVTTKEYPTPARRPMRSTMLLDKIQEKYKIEIKHWENSLEECIRILNN